MSNKGCSIFTLLGLIFVVLKLCGVIDWSWWWVTLPFWVPVAFFVVAFVVMGWLLGIFED